MGSKECPTEVNSACLFSNDMAWIVDFLNIMVKKNNTKFTILIIFKYTVQWC